MLEDGLYEQIINRALEEELSKSDKVKEIASIDAEEAPKILSMYVKETLERVLEYVKDTNKSKEGGSLTKQIELVNRIVALIGSYTDDDSAKELLVSERAEELFALMKRENNIEANREKVSFTRPETSLLESSLFTGARNEPQMASEIKKEICYADSIDMLVSFIKWSGLRLIINELRDFAFRGGRLRVISTSYMGATDIKAIEELSRLPNTDIKISYDTQRTRLHAKTYVFYRKTGFTTAYVGSSNLSNSAISSGLEWNIKVTEKELPDTLDKISMTFESYWNSSEFEYYRESDYERLKRALNAESYKSANSMEFYTLDIQPYSYQKEILDVLEAERKVHNRYRNLVVAATGTGKTVISALDYRRFRSENNGRARLLFVCHREEILRQSLYTFRAVLKDPNFGQICVGSSDFDSYEHLFISIQSFNSKSFFEKTTSDYYDYIVVDEFHHAAAPSYNILLSYYRPKVLLGLTATPERMDGKSILPYFDNRIAAEIRLPEAIDRKLLCPFQYFGVTDTIDLDSLKWTRGGYDKTELSKVYTLSGEVARRRAELVVLSLLKYVTDIDKVKGLGFAVSVEHAEFMSDYFNERNIPSVSITSKSTYEDRKSAKERLVSGEIRFIFTVDIYNEGVDIPEVNTVLFLRPTESLTIFLQQLGRGLRLSEGKECLTVLDFIGMANKKYSFESKFSALMKNTGNSLASEIKRGFPSLPKGCFIELERKATEHILENIRASYSNRAGLVSKIASFEEDSGLSMTLGNFLNYYHLEPKSIYKYSSFTRLKVLSGLEEDFYDPLEEKITKALLKLSYIDSIRWIKYLERILENYDWRDDIDIILGDDTAMFEMFYATLWSKTVDDFEDQEVRENLDGLMRSPLRQEMLELLRYREDAIDFVDDRVDLGFDSPLDLHCTYTRDQILASFGYKVFSAMREGVLYLKDKKTDIFFITLNKADKDYSPTTMYRDYSINESLFHWQSQSTTSDTSSTGQRYIHHKELGSNVVLFVRESKKDGLTGSVSPYTYLGKASYVEHKGSRPMNITWRMEKPIPAKYLKKTNSVLVG